MRRPSHPDSWLYLALALPIAIVFALITPPFQSPDEVMHYWRASAVAQGQLVPQILDDGKAGAMLPTDARDLVARLWVQMAGQLDKKFDRDAIRDAWNLQPSMERVPVQVPSLYSAMVYAPQGLGIAAGRLVRAPTLGSFYAGRIANAFAGTLLVFLAMRLLPEAAWVFGVIGLTPMYLSLAGAFSADTVTIGVAFCTIAAALRPAGARSLPLFCGLLSLAKSGYALIVLLALPRLRFRQERARVAVSIVVAALCLLLASISARRVYYPLRGDVTTDASTQLSRVLHDPIAFLKIAIADYRITGAQYRDHIVGRLGWLDVGLPSAVIYGYWLVFLYAAVSLSLRLNTLERVTIIAVLLATMLLLSLSQYLIWTAVGADHIEGLQGRYFLPILPLAILALSTPRARLYRLVPLAAGVIANIAAIYAVIQRYYGA